MSSLLDEAQELIEISLDVDAKDAEYTRKARVWLEKAKNAVDEHACHDHDHDGAHTSCSVCGFDLSCPSCGG